MLLTAAAHADVNVRDFDQHVIGGDWSGAIQAAVDSVAATNGFSRGGTVFFPAGTYRVDHTIIVGNNPEHWGLRLLGYGATLVGSVTLDQQPLVDPEPEAAELGVPILVLKDPDSEEGAGYCIEGLRFTREAEQTGVAVSVPFSEVPKGTVFRSLKIHNQRVGIHINYGFQFSFVDCIVRGNHTGVVIQNQGNNVGIVNCIFRRNNYHGLVIGPDRGSWASDGHHISGSIFEANKGYGILLISSGQTVITGNYFEANGNAIGVLTPYDNTTIDTNFFWDSYGYGWQRNPYSDNAHIVLGRINRVQLRNNHYREVTAWVRRQEGATRWEYVPRQGTEVPVQEPGYVYEERPCGILIVGNLERSGSAFDALPIVHHDVTVTCTQVASDSGLHYYEYDGASNEFVEKSLLGGLSAGAGSLLRVSSSRSLSGPAATASLRRR